MFELASLLGGDPQTITQPLTEVFEFEQKIAQVSYISCNLQSDKMKGLMRA